jgi:hypothetical protein
MPEIKQESFETPHTPNSIPGGNILSNLPFTYVPPTSIKPIVPAPTIVQHTTMSTMPYKMPFHSTDCTPKFDGTLDMLTEFIDVYEHCVDRAGLQGLDRIKGIIKYLECNDQELWAGLPKALVSNYNVSMKEIKVMYPGWDGKRQYASVDLQALMHEYTQKPMFSGQELSAYLCVFRKIMQPLLNEDCIGKWSAIAYSWKESLVRRRRLSKCALLSSTQITTLKTHTCTCKCMTQDSLYCQQMHLCPPPCIMHRMQYQCSVLQHLLHVSRCLRQGQLLSANIGMRFLALMTVLSAAVSNTSLCTVWRDKGT